MAGFLAYVLELGGRISSSLSPVEILSKIDSKNFKTKHVRIKGLLPRSHPDGSDLFALIMALKNRGFIVSLEHPGDYFPLWAEQVQYNIVITAVPKILGVRARELWYYLDDIDQPDIELGKIPIADLPVLYLKVGLSSGSDLFAWIEKSAYNWAILPRPSERYKVTLL